MGNFRLVDHRRATLSSYRAAESIIHDPQELVDRLVYLTIPGSADFTCYSSAKDQLLVCIAGEHAVVQFISRSGSPPYLIATIAKNRQEQRCDQDSIFTTLPLFDFLEPEEKSAKVSRTQSIKFNIGGTPTYFSDSWCISLQEMISIVVHFFQCGELSKEFTWETV